MKRILFAALAIVLIASLAWGVGGALMDGGVAATGSSTVEQTGTVCKANDSYGTVSQSCTVPADATLAVLFAGAGNNTTNWLDTSGFTLGGSAFTPVTDTDGQTSLRQAWVAALVSPTSGTQTLARSGDGPSGAGMTVMVVFFKGINTSSPVRSSGTDPSESLSITGMTYDTGDLMVGAAVGGSAPTVTGSSQTLVDSHLANYLYMGIAKKADVGAFSYTGQDYSTAVAVVLGHN